MRGRDALLERETTENDEKTEGIVAGAEVPLDLLAVPVMGVDTNTGIV